MGWVLAEPVEGRVQLEDGRLDSFNRANVGLALVVLAGGVEGDDL